MSVLSVDLGTSNTVAVLSAHGRAPRVVDVDGASTMPSAVFAGPDGLVVGREAERRARLDPARFEPNPKRRIDDGQLLLGDVVLPVTDVLAAVLRKVAAETTRQLGGERLRQVRLTHPAQWGPVRRAVLLSAARQAGLGTDLLLVPEPVAAAAHYASFSGQAIDRGGAVAVYDLGAGTFDVAVVGATDRGYTVLAENGLADLGGLDVDHALLHHIGGQVQAKDPGGWQRLLLPSSTSDRRAARAVREDVRAAKEALSGHPQTELPLPDPFGDVLVTRAELEQLIRPNLARSVELLAATIRSTGIPLGQLTGIYLVGGSSRIPLVAQLIAETLGIVPTTLDQPETAVALGAHHLDQEGISLRTTDLPPGAAPTSALPQVESRTVSMAPAVSAPRPAPVAAQQRQAGPPVQRQRVAQPGSAPQPVAPHPVGPRSNQPLPSPVTPGPGTRPRPMGPPPRPQFAPVTPDRHPTRQLAPNQHTPNQQGPSQHSPNQLAPNQHSPNQQSPSQQSPTEQVSVQQEAPDRGTGNATGARVVAGLLLLVVMVISTGPQLLRADQLVARGIDDAWISFMTLALAGCTIAAAICLFRRRAHRFCQVVSVTAGLLLVVSWSSWRYWLHSDVFGVRQMFTATVFRYGPAPLVGAAVLAFAAFGLCCTRGVRDAMRRTR